MSDADDILAQAAKLPLPDRIKHKNWKVREEAYKALLGKFAENAVIPGLTEDKDINYKLWDEFTPGLAKLCKDTNAAAQLSAFVLVTKFTESAPVSHVQKAAPDVAKAIADKGFTGRPINITKGSEALLGFVYSGVAEPVLEALSSIAFPHKVPKVVQASVELVTEAVNTFGASHFPVKTLAKYIPQLLDHQNAEIRNCTKQLIVTLYRWIGKSVNSIYKDAKEVTVKEIQTLIEESSKDPEKPAPKRLTRSAEAAQMQPQQGGQTSSENNNGFQYREDKDDELDLTTEVDLLLVIKGIRVEIDEAQKDWNFAIESKGWNHRKEALDALVNATLDCRLKEDDFSDIVAKLKKIIAKDINVNVTASAAKVVMNLANALRNKMNINHGKALCAALLTRLKEKNVTLTDAVSKALDALHSKKCIKISDILDEVLQESNNKVPKARIEVLGWLKRCLAKGTSPATLLPINKSLCLGLVKASEDSSGEVRDLALTCFAHVSVLLGQKPVAPYVEKLDKVRQDKLTSNIEEVIKERNKEAEESAKEVEKPNPSTQKNQNKSFEPRTQKISKPMRVLSTSTAAASVPVGSSPHPTAASNTASPVAAPVTLAAPKKVLKYLERNTDVLLSDESVANAASKFFPDSPLNDLEDKSMKTRATVTEEMLKIIETQSILTADKVALIMTLLKRSPGLHDNYFQASQNKLEMLKHCATVAKEPLPKNLCNDLLVPTIEKLGDMKCAKLATEVLLCVTEATDVEYMFSMVLTSAKETKNMRALSNFGSFVQKLLTSFDIKFLPSSIVIELVVFLSNQDAPAIRKGAAGVATTFVRKANLEDAVNKLKDAGVNPDTVATVEENLSRECPPQEESDRKTRFFVNAQEAVAALDNAHTSKPQKAEPEHKPVNKMVESNSVKSSIVISPKKSNNVTITDENVKQNSFSPTTKQPPARVQVVKDVTSLSKIIKQILVDLGNKDWEKRLVALQSLETSLKQSEESIDSGLDFELITALKARTADSNRNLAPLAYSNLGFIAGRIENPSTYSKSLVPYILTKGCGDNKKPIHDAAFSCLEAWEKVIGSKVMLTYVPSAMESANSATRKDILKWILTAFETSNSGDCTKGELDEFIGPVISCLQDKNAEVRQLAEVLFDHVIASTGPEPFIRQYQDMPVASRNQLKPLFEKHPALMGHVVKGPRAIASPVRNDTGKNGRSSMTCTPSRSAQKRKEAQSTPLRPPCSGRSQSVKQLDKELDSLRLKENISQNIPVGRSNSVGNGSRLMTAATVSGRDTSSPLDDEIESPLPPRVSEVLSQAMSLQTPAPTNSAAALLAEATPAMTAVRAKSRTNATITNVKSSYLVLLLSENEARKLEGVKAFCAAIQNSDTSVFTSLSEVTPILVSNLRQSMDNFIRSEGTVDVERRSVGYYLNGLMKIFLSNDLAQIVSHNSIESLLGYLLDQLINPNLISLKKETNIMKALNLLVLKILENSNRSGVFTALLNILRDAPRSSDAKNNLVVKCLIKMTKSGFDNVHLDILLRDVHLYLLANPPSRKKNEQEGSSVDSELPLKAVKSILNELCKLYGEKISNHLTLVPVESNPIIVSYIQLILKNFQDGKVENSKASPKNCSAKVDLSPIFATSSGVSKLEGGMIAQEKKVESSGAHNEIEKSVEGRSKDIVKSTDSMCIEKSNVVKSEVTHDIPKTPQVSSTQQDETESFRTPKRSPQVSMTVHEPITPSSSNPQLISIFSKIGCRATNDEGIKELFAFSKQHPEVSIQPHLRKSSTVFQNFIGRELEKLRLAEQKARSMSMETPIDMNLTTPQPRAQPVTQRNTQPEAAAPVVEAAACPLPPSPEMVEMSENKQSLRNGATSSVNEFYPGHAEKMQKKFEQQIQIPVADPPIKQMNSGDLYLQKLREIQKKYGITPSQGTKVVSPSNPPNPVSAVTTVMNKENDGRNANYTSSNSKDSSSISTETKVFQSTEGPKSVAASFRERLARIQANNKV